MKHLNLIPLIAILNISLFVYGQGGGPLVVTNPPPALPTQPKLNTGWYIGFEAGMSTPTDWLVGHFSDGVPTRCDGWLAGGNPNGPGCVGYNDVWSSEIETAKGLTIGGRLGYAWDFNYNWRVRFEGEYLRRQMQGDSSLNEALAATASSQKAGEFAFIWEQISDITIEQAGLNAIIDIPLTDKFMPFAGVGIAGVDPQYTYHRTSHRHPDAQMYYDLANEAMHGRIPSMELAQSGSGTWSFGEFPVNDLFVLAGQAQFGVNYTVADNSELGFKMRYTRFPWFGSDPTTQGSFDWTPLRSHDSTSAPNGEPIQYESTLGRLYNPDMSGEWLDDPNGTGLWDISVQYSFFLGR